MRKRNNPPVFQRWSWASYFPGNCLYVSDPTLHLDDNIGLAWYAGTEDFDPLPAIADVVREICLQLEINAGQVFTYGSSGGGFAALRMGEFLPHSGAVAVNPQIIVTDYEMKSPDRYLNLCFSGRSRATAIREFEDRLSILSHTDRLRSQRCIYIQNTLDAHHYEHHFVPFCAKMGEEPVANTTAGTFRRLLFAHPDGHRKAETQDMFDAAMNIVEHW